MKNRIIITALIAAAICLTACTQQKNTSETELTTQVPASSSTQASTETTTDALISVPDDAYKYTGTYTELMAQHKNSINITLEGDTYTAKANIVNDAFNIPQGEYTAVFKYADIKETDDTYTVTTTVQSGEVSYNLVIAFYGEDGSIRGASITLNNYALEFIKGTPAN